MALLVFQVYLFGGVQDVKDDDEELEGNFFNDLYTVSIENEKATWSEGETSFQIFFLFATMTTMDLFRLLSERETFDNKIFGLSNIICSQRDIGCTEDQRSN